LLLGIPQWNTRVLLYTTVITLYFAYSTYLYWRYTGGVVFSVLEHPKKLVRYWL